MISEAETIRRSGLSRDAVKYIAMAAMFCNHFATALLFGALNLASWWGTASPALALGRAALSCAGIAAAGCVLLLAYSGRRARRGRTFSKWFFYAFYPAHLLLLGLLKLAWG